MKRIRLFLLIGLASMMLSCATAPRIPEQKKLIVPENIKQEKIIVPENIRRIPVERIC